jgi:hypothetical protein
MANCIRRLSFRHRAQPAAQIGHGFRSGIGQRPAVGGRLAVDLDDANVVADLPTAAELASYKADGIPIVAPPTFALLTVNGAGQIVPSQYALDAKAAGLGSVTWTLERSGILAEGNNRFYFQSFDSAIRREGDVFLALDVLARQVGVIGVFADWPATVTFYANCMGLKQAAAIDPVYAKQNMALRTSDATARSLRPHLTAKKRLTLQHPVQISMDGSVGCSCPCLCASCGRRSPCRRAERWRALPAGRSATRPSWARPCTSSCGPSAERTPTPPSKPCWPRCTASTAVTARTNLSRNCRA